MKMRQPLKIILVKNKRRKDKKNVDGSYGNS